MLVSLLLVVPFLFAVAMLSLFLCLHISSTDVLGVDQQVYHLLDVFALRVPHLSLELSLQFFYFSTFVSSRARRHSGICGHRSRRGRSMFALSCQASTLLPRSSFTTYVLVTKSPDKFLLHFGFREYFPAEVSRLCSTSLLLGVCLVVSQYLRHVSAHDTLDREASLALCWFGRSVLLCRVPLARSCHSSP